MEALILLGVIGALIYLHAILTRVNDVASMLERALNPQGPDV
jgi:hypothetical protein